MDIWGRGCGLGQAFWRFTPISHFHVETHVEGEKFELKNKSKRKNAKHLSLRRNGENGEVDMKKKKKRGDDGELSLLNLTA